jgi:hypothetical protein
MKRTRARTHEHLKALSRIGTPRSACRSPTTLNQTFLISQQPR